MSITRPLCESYSPPAASDFWRALSVYFCRRVCYNTVMASDNSKTIISGVAVSGGVDSMVMLDVLVKEKKNVVVINVEHGIRGDASVSDSEFVAEYCKERGIKCLTYAVDAPQYARENNVSIELAARTLRYEIFDKLLKEKTVDEINLAHHLNDQVRLSGTQNRKLSIMPSITAYRTERTLPISKLAIPATISVTRYVRR